MGPALCSTRSRTDAFVAPVAMKRHSPEALSSAGIMVSLACGALDPAGTEATQAGPWGTRPGKSDAVCPSVPIPSTVKSIRAPAS